MYFRATCSSRMFVRVLRIWPKVGAVSVVRCSGRMIEGPETARLIKAIQELLPNTRRVVLQMAGVGSIDSGGLGLLVRVVTRT